MTDFKKGDVVKMLSGGPKMTIVDLGDYSGSGLGPESGAKCQWFEKEKLKEAVFETAALEIAPKMGLGVTAVRR